MSRIVASLAAALAALGLTACGTGGAEPDAPSGGAPANPSELDLVLDFQPNAVHAGIYSALASGALTGRGIELGVREPGSATDAPKLLEAGRADAAILDIQDLAIARASGFDLVGIGAIVQRPLAAVIADADRVKTVGDLSGARIGVTGLPSDDAVLDAVFDSGGRSRASPTTVTIGFRSVAALSAGRVDAITAFWNAEGVALRDLGVPTREFRVDRIGAPRYPELVLVAERARLEADRKVFGALLDGLSEGYATAVSDPGLALDRMLEAVDGLDPDSQRKQMDALSEVGAFDPPLALDRRALEQWSIWAAAHGIVSQPPAVGQTFDVRLAGR